MLIEETPARPVSKQRKPDGFTQYKVKDGDTLENIAQRYYLTSGELAYENFKTKDPGKINWYLRNRVGCTQLTEDGKHWAFSSDATPGTIYVPKQKTNVPKKLEGERKVPLLKNVWAGVAKAHSGDLFVVGAHDLTGMVYNLGDGVPGVRNAMLNINGFKFGAGLGGSISAVFVLCYGYKSAEAMNGVAGGPDFDLALGAKLSSLLKSFQAGAKAVDTVQKYKKTRYIAENLIKNRSFATEDSAIITLPIPLAGVGLHAWGGYKFGDVSIMSTGKGLV